MTKMWHIRNAGPVEPSFGRSPSSTVRMDIPTGLPTGLSRPGFATPARPCPLPTVRPPAPPRRTLVWPSGT
ncbi:hypothetical protein RHODOP_03046 [Rhodoplanes sp. P11]